MPPLTSLLVDRVSGGSPPPSLIDSIARRHGRHASGHVRVLVPILTLPWPWAGPLAPPPQVRGRVGGQLAYSVGAPAAGDTPALPSYEWSSGAPEDTPGQSEVPREGWSRPLPHQTGTEGLGIAHPPPSSQGAGPHGAGCPVQPRGLFL